MWVRIPLCAPMDKERIEYLLKKWSPILNASPSDLRKCIIIESQERVLTDKEIEKLHGRVDEGETGRTI